MPLPVVIMIAIRSTEIRRSNSALAEVELSVIRTHPETGRKGLFVNRRLTIRFRDMSQGSSLGAARTHLSLSVERQRNRLLGQLPRATFAIND